MRIHQSFDIEFSYDVLFTEHVFDLNNPLLIDLLNSASPENRQIKVGVVIDSGFIQYHQGLEKSIEMYFRQSTSIKLALEPLIVNGGEDAKNSMDDFLKTLSLINDGKIDRHSFLIAIGGGAVLDMVGFAAAVGHRGIRHLRIPTTVLSQNDSGVGVKNGINFFGKKNFLGTFAPPFSVINDIHFLTSLSDRDWISGISEAVKVALIKNKDFYQWLKEHAQKLRDRNLEEMKVLVYECAKLHADHIAKNNDPFETGSSRPLDYGHWAAHKMEQLTNFELKHGEAVAIGLAMDIYYGGFAGFMNEETCDEIAALLQHLGFTLFHPVLLNESQNGLNPELLKGLEEFREHLGGELTITMVKEIGKKFEVHEMNPEFIKKAVLKLKSLTLNYAN